MSPGNLFVIKGTNPVCGQHACSVSCRFCVLDSGFALAKYTVFLNIQIISSSSSPSLLVQTSIC